MDPKFVCECMGGDCEFSADDESWKDPVGRELARAQELYMHLNACDLYREGPPLAARGLSRKD